LLAPRKTIRGDLLSLHLYEEHERDDTGFYVRHVNGITMKNVTLRLDDEDFRPAMVFDDVKNKQLEAISLPDGTSKEHQIFEIE